MSSKTFVILGCGRMGTAIAHHIAEFEKDAEMIFQDAVTSQMLALRAKIGRGRVIEGVSVRYALSRKNTPGSVTVIASSGYDTYESFADWCAQEGFNWIDLGGNRSVVMEQRKHSDLAVRNGCAIVPDCGLAPGMINVLAMHAYDRLVASGAYCNDVSVEMFVGGLPHDNTFVGENSQDNNPMRYSLVWSADGLINEYIEPCDEIVNGTRKLVAPLSGLKSFYFSRTTNSASHHSRGYEAFSTSGGSSNLPELLDGRVKNLSYRTIRHPGHRNIIKSMHRLGMFDQENRSTTEEMFETKLTNVTEEDVVIAQARAYVPGKSVQLSVYCENKIDPKMTAMAQTTGFSAAIIARMIANGELNAKGVLMAEAVVDPTKFISHLNECGIFVKDETF